MVIKMKKSLSPYYETERGRLYCGDCLEIMSEIDETVDLVLADPPYGITGCKWDTVIPLELMWRLLRQAIKPSGVILLTASQPFTTTLISSNVKMFKYEWIWNKVNGSNFMNIKNRPFKTQEQILVFSETAGFTFNPERVSRSELSLKRDPPGQKSCRRIRTAGAVEHYGGQKRKESSFISADGMKHPIDIIKFSIHEKGRYRFKHPTKKPIALMEYLIKTYSNRNEIVLDFAIGSGTTAVACERLNRRWIGIEISEEYCEITVKRIEDERKQLKTF